MFWNRDSKKPIVDKVKETDPHTVHGDVDATLKRCYRERTEIAVTLGHPPQVYVGHLSRLGRTTIVLTLDNLETNSAPVSGHICGAVFHYGPTSGGFLAAVRQVNEQNIVLERPSMVTYVDARRSFRIPVSPSDGLDIQLVCGAESWPCPVLDLSRGGIGLRFREDAVLTNGNIVELRVTWMGQCFTLTTLIARQVHDILGLIFNVAEGTPEAERLTALVTTIERNWLRRERESTIY